MKQMFSFLVASLLSIGTLFAYSNYDAYRFAEGDGVYVYATVANVRNGISTNHGIIDQLIAGHDAVVTEVSQNVEEINGITAPWVTIEYQKEGQVKQGYVWGGVLSITQLRRGNVKFVYGMEKVGLDEDGSTLGIKVVKDDKIVASTTCNVFTIPTRAVVTDSKGLEYIDHIIEISSSGEACGVFSYDHYFAWTGTDVVYLQSSNGMGDGGILYESETLIFPSTGAPYGTIIKVKAEGENDDDNNEATPNGVLLFSKERFKTEIYKWTGKRLIKQDQNW